MVVLGITGGAVGIAYDVELLTELDFIFARGKFARALKGSQPIFNTDGIIDIKEDKVIDRECTYNEYLGIE